MTDTESTSSLLAYAVPGGRDDSIAWFRQLTYFLAIGYGGYLVLYYCGQIAVAVTMRGGIVRAFFRYGLTPGNSAIFAAFLILGAASIAVFAAGWMIRCNHPKAMVLLRYGSLILVGDMLAMDAWSLIPQLSNMMGSIGLTSIVQIFLLLSFMIPNVAVPLILLWIAWRSPLSDKKLEK